MKAKKAIVLALAIVLVCSFDYVYAENIDPCDNDSQYAWAENIGWVNFEPNVAGPNVGATVTDHNLSGFIWSENIGWINLWPKFGGVTNDGDGRLSGYTWSENVGWINFDPNVPGDSNDYGVTIDSEGNFSGWAWGENIGWINFNSPDLYGYSVEVCKVNFIDLGNFVEDWLQSGLNLPGDLSDNNDVDLVDYSMFADYWLTYCPDGWALKQ